MSPFKSDEMHKDLVRLIYDHWRKHGKWPLLADFMVQHRDKGDVYTKLRELPWTILNTPTSLHEDQLKIELFMSLRLRFLGFCLVAKEAEPALFVRMLPIFHEHYEATVGSNTLITADEVAERLGEPTASIRQLAPLLEYEGHAGIVRTTNEDDSVWAVRITREIDDWHAVKTIDEYIKRRVEHDENHSSAELITMRSIHRALGATPLVDGTEPVDFANAFERMDAPVRPLLGLIEELRVMGALTPPFAILLGRDGGEIGLCIEAGANKSALILCGGILEGVLTSVLMHNSSVAEREFQKLRARRKFPDGASLPDLVEMCRRALCPGLRPLLREIHHGLSQLINGHRNLIHPHAEIRGEQLPIDPHTVAAVLASLQVLLAGILREISAGWLTDYRNAL